MDQNKPQVTEPVETYESLAELMEHDLLRPDLSTDEVAEGCRLARQYGIRAVVVRPCDLDQVVRWTRGGGISVASTVGYPDGTSTTAAKLYEGRDLIRLGAKELEFAMNPARMIGRQFQHVELELQQMSESCRESGVLLKIGFNNRYLTDDLKIIGTKIAKRIEANFLALDASEADLLLVRPLLRDVLLLKQATPVQTLEEALLARKKGFTRIISAETATILTAWKERLAQTAEAHPQS